MQGMVKDFDKVSYAIDYLKANDILTVEKLNEHLGELEKSSKLYNSKLKYNVKRYKVIDGIKEHYAAYKKLKPAYDSYSKIYFKRFKEKFYNNHKAEIDEYRKAVRYLKANHGSLVLKKGECTGQQFL